MPSRLQVDKGHAREVIAQALFRARAQQHIARQNFDPVLGATPEEAEDHAAECRESLAEYTRYVHGHEPARHHLFWIDLLERMERRELPQRKLLLLAPPNMAKSTYVSLAFVKWYLGRHPDHNVLFLTSADTNANLFGGAVREGLRNDYKHRNVFPAPACRPNEKRGWSGDAAFLMGTPMLQPFPAYRSVGWGGSIIGARANLIIVDDPLSQQSANSPTEQKAAWELMDKTVIYRLQKPDECDGDYSKEGILVCVMTRWVEDDIAGKIKEIEKERPDDWLVVELPGLAEEEDPLGREPGEPLWPERFPLTFYQTERSKGEALFQIVFQHNPLAAGGEIFKNREKFRPLPADFYFGTPAMPSMYNRCVRLIYVDPAFSKQDTACYSVIFCFCIDTAFNMYITHITRARVDQLGLENMMVQDIARHRPHLVVMEASAFRVATVRDIAFNVMRRALCTIKDIPSTQDKILRAQLPAGRVQADTVFVDLTAPWAPPFINECMGFPHMKFKDHVDAFSGGAEMVQYLQFQSVNNAKPKQLIWGS